MSPRGSVAATSPTQPARSSNTPYSRRSASQPKSSRQQFSACGACRMRRVRCDLKDLPIGSLGPHPACSNCKERGIKCVDEFADVKAVKLLRRGRRLQQVEAIYGKVADQGSNSSSSSLPATISSNIPILHSNFFASPFWRWFSIQRPVLDATEFPARFAAHCKGTHLLGNEGGLIAMLLVTWAASFGLDERGMPQAIDTPADQSGATESPKSESSSSYLSQSSTHAPPGSRRRQWKNRSETFLREILELIDLHGILRRPTLDGVRVLLLLLPLMEDAQPLERLAIYEAALSQVQALCVLSASHPSTFEDAAVRARIFWYAYTQEGLITGIRGGRFVLNGEDLETFQRTLPSLNIDMESANFSARDISSQKAYTALMHAASTPLELSNICRKIHGVLTGIKATRRAEDHGLIDAHGMREIWRDLDRCWQELDSMQRAPLEHDNARHRLEISQFVGSWQIFIFECHNVIREGLKHFISNPTSQAMYSASSPSRPSSHSSNSSPYLSPQHLHVIATRRCLALLPLVIRILEVHTPREHSDVPGIFRWDAGLVRDGCFFAGYLAASVDGELLDIPSEGDKQEDVDCRLTVDEGVPVCLKALAAMRWGYSKTEEREETVRMIWETRKLRRHRQVHHSPLYDTDYSQHVPLSAPHIPLNLSSSPHPGLSPTPVGDRPMLPPLNFMAQRRVDSAPSTACSADGRGLNGWPSYTPPGTATSVATSTGTALSGRGSPVFSNMPTFKTSADDIFYHGSGDIDQFTYNAPLTGPVVRENSDMLSYGSRHPALETHALTASSATNYIADSAFDAPSATLLTDFHSCPQFGENCNGTYH